MSALFLAVSLLVPFVNGNPSRSIAQPGWTRIAFGLFWVTLLVAALGIALTAADRRKAIEGEPLRYTLLAAGLSLTVFAAFLLGVIP
jgi:quinol-cytochrome oxidoreductase complex cytochrome b subunit